MPDVKSLPTTLDGLRQALANGERHVPGLRLRDLDGVDLDLSHCVLRGGCLREARFGHASLAEADVKDSKQPPGQSRGAIWRRESNPPGGTNSAGKSL